jgi:hypothetical protein
MSIYLVNFPAPCLVRKHPTVYPTSFAEDCLVKARGKALELMLSPQNVVCRINDKISLYSYTMPIDAESEAEALAIAKIKAPTVQFHLFA